MEQLRDLLISKFRDVEQSQTTTYLVVENEDSGEVRRLKTQINAKFDTFQSVAVHLHPECTIHNCVSLIAFAVQGGNGKETELRPHYENLLFVCNELLGYFSMLEKAVQKSPTPVSHHNSHTTTIGGPGVVKGIMIGNGDGPKILTTHDEVTSYNVYTITFCVSIAAGLVDFGFGAYFHSIRPTLFGRLFGFK